MATPSKAVCPPPSRPEEKPDLRPVEGAEADAELALLGKAVGHVARVQILRLLRPESCICGDIVDELPLAQSTVSQPAGRGPGPQRARQRGTRHARPLLPRRDTAELAALKNCAGSFPAQRKVQP